MTSPRSRTPALPTWPLGLARDAQAPARPDGGGPARRLGTYELHQSVGHSSRTVAWLAVDTARGQEALVLLARAPHATGAGREAALVRVAAAARLDHPRLLRAVAHGDHAGRTWLAIDLPSGATPLSIWLHEHPGPSIEDGARWCAQVLEGLATLHDAACSHGDIGVHTLLVDRQGHLQLWGAGLMPEPGEASVTPTPMPAATDERAGQRLAAEGDLLALALLWHHWLARRPALDEPDLPSACARAHGETVRLPWDLPAPIPSPLRAIVNRATDRHATRRYLHARSFLAAIERWCAAQADRPSSALDLLAERMERAGHLPARPGLAQRVVQVGRMEMQRIDALTEVILEDPALSIELLRVANAMRSGVGREAGVSTVRRAVELIGTVGVRRAASGLRAWPGPLGKDAAMVLDRALRRACVAGHLAALLTPPGLDPEASSIAAVLQRLGHLLLLYHFPDEAIQIEQLSAHASTPAERTARARTTRLDPDAAALAVLGVRTDDLALSVARHWGLDDELQQLLVPVSLRAPVLVPNNTQGWLRVVASAANEAHDATTRRPAATALQQVASRYAKVLGLDFAGLADHVRQARQRHAAQA